MPRPRCAKGRALRGVPRKIAMYVCVCHAITEADVENCIAQGAKSLCGLRGCLGIASTCGQCAKLAEQMLERATAMEVPKSERKVA